MSRIAAVIPAFNAAGTIAAVIGGVSVYLPAEQILIVDDGSTDKTSHEAVSAGARVLRHTRNRGKGAALRTGLDFALQASFDAVITLDADLQHPPESIPQFIDLYEREKINIIIGSRLHDVQGMPFHRILSNAITTFLVNARTSSRIADSQSGYRLLDRPVLEAVRTVSDGFEAETEFLIRAALHGFTFGAVPIRTVYAGERSHMTHLATTVNFIKVLFRDY
ncbi:MAG TPA: glycosyltransferase family 2 protein [Bacteroidota bacterium]|nr:glycosyltransferase family 2 protein [Bacteroidota bacterium]